MPSIELYDSGVNFSPYGYHPVWVRVNYSENYVASGNYTTVTITSVDAKTNFNLGSVQFNGDGISFSPNNSSWTNVTSTWGHYTQVNIDSSYSQISNVSGGSLKIYHNSSGTATLYVKVSGTINYYNGSYWTNSGSHAASNSTSLTTHTSTLTVYPNGGSWNGSSSNQSFTQAPSTTKYIANPSRTGFTFAGWSLSGGGSLSGTTYTFGGSSGTLTATWNRDSYTLTTQVSPTGSGTVTAGGSVGYGLTKTLTATPASITGYTVTFHSWSVSGSGSVNPTTSATTTFTMGAGNATVTANISIVANTYYVKFNGNGSTGGTMANQSFTYGEAAKPLTSNQFVKTNYSFVHWNTAADDSGVVYENEQSVQNLASSGTINLYAIWSLNGYPVTYNANGHGTAPAAQIKPIGQDLQILSFISEQYADGMQETYVITGDANGGIWTGADGSATNLPHYIYTQSQWNTNPNGTGIVYMPNDIYTVDSALSLYAIWQQGETRDYTYNVPSGAPSKDEMVMAVYDPNGGSLISTPSLDYASRNCPFEGWYTEPTGGVARDSTSEVLASETVYAHYEDIPFSPYITPNKYECTKELSELLGWATSSSATVPDYAPGVEIQPIPDNEIVFALDSWSQSGAGNQITKDISSWSTQLTQNDYFNLQGSVGTVESNSSVQISDAFYWDGATRNYDFTILGTPISMALSSAEISITATGSKPMVDLNFFTGGLPGQVLYAIWGTSGEVYIGGNKYKILIYDGVNWGQYQAFISDGSNWVPY